MGDSQSNDPSRFPTPGPKRWRGWLLALVIVLVLSSIGGVGYTLFLAPRGPIGKVSVRVPNTTLDQGDLIVVTASLLDRQNIDQARNATFNWSASPASALDIIIKGRVSFRIQVRAIEPGNVTLTSTGTWRGESKSSQVKLQIRALHLELRASKDAPVLGEPVVITVTAVRSNSRTPDRIARGYGGMVNFTVEDPSSADLPTDATFSPGTDSGTKSFLGLVIKKAGLLRIMARDTEVPINGTITLLGDTAPVADFSATPNGSNPLEVTLSGEPSYDPDTNDTIVSYEWSFGDGAPTMVGQTVSHTYASAGAYSVSLTVRDNHDASAKAAHPYNALAPPVARFMVFPMVNATNGSATHGPDLKALVNALSSFDPDGTVVEYSWDFGDGWSESTLLPFDLHVYNSTYENHSVNVVLVVTDDDGLRASASRSITVTWRSLPPTADFTVSYVDAVNLNVRVDASASSDPNGDLLYYNWSWGDGSWTSKPWPGVVATHTYAVKGTYTINLTVIDFTGLTDTVGHSVVVIPPPLPPRADFSVARNKLHVVVDGGKSTDPNKDITDYAWNWGDGTPGSAGQVAGHDYARPGLYTITLTATDATSLRSTKSHRVSAANTTLDYTFYDFFNVPYPEYWDYRIPIYGETPVNAECFNRTSSQWVGDIAPRCTPNPNDNVPDYASYPYTNWYPLVGGSTSYNGVDTIPFIYAPYRWHAVGVNVPGYDLAEPVFLPVTNYGEATGSRLDFNWHMDYINTEEAEALRSAPTYCPVSSQKIDGYVIRSQINLTMDLQESKRIFGVDDNITNQSGALWWWYSKPIRLPSNYTVKNVDPLCYRNGAVEIALSKWFVAMGGDATSVGKYDIENGYEYYYSPFYTNMVVAVDNDGTTHISIDHAAWGTEVLMARFLHWGNASYSGTQANNYIDGGWHDWTKAKGWWGMETAWFEDFTYQGSFGPQSFDFDLSTAEEYHFQLVCTSGPNGVYDRTDDGVAWNWGPSLDDYLIEYAAGHISSEMVPYENKAYPHCTPGSNNRAYGADFAYDYTPTRWDLSLGQTWHFQFPKGNVIFYDPNHTPPAANPRAAFQFVPVYKPLALQSTFPEGYGTWDPQAKTWDVYGPSSTGGPDGSPGHYPDDPWGSINLQPEG